jgi:carbon storage regulator
MLILARRPGERVVIGDEIMVTVMEVSASTVRLGIEAPRGVSIFREEIWLAVKEENRAAAEAQADALPSAPIEEVRADAAGFSSEVSPQEGEQPQEGNASQGGSSQQEKGSRQGQQAKGSQQAEQSQQGEPGALD